MNNSSLRKREAKLSSDCNQGEGGIVTAYSRAGNQALRVIEAHLRRAE